jgi:hypothetical protein
MFGLPMQRRVNLQLKRWAFSAKSACDLGTERPTHRLGAPTNCSAGNLGRIAGHRNRIYRDRFKFWQDNDNLRAAYTQPKPNRRRRFLS